MAASALRAALYHVIEFKYDDFPWKRAVLSGKCCTFVAGQYPGSFSTESGTASNPADIVEGAYTFEKTDM
jgi:hypothetical protein